MMESFFFQWRTSSSGEFVTVPSSALYFDKDASIVKGSAFKAQEKTAGDKSPLSGVHPSYNLTQARPNDFKPKQLSALGMQPVVSISSIR